MFPRAAEDIPSLVTSAVLDAYVAYVIRNTSGNSGDPSQTPAPADANSTGVTVPATLEEALAPLEVLFGKTALNAVGIALHGTEGIVRYVERTQGSDTERPAGFGCTSSRSAEEEEERERTTEKRALPPTDEIANLASMNITRWVYRVGDHTLFSPYYCPCSAYAFQSIRREEIYFCKHLLALQIVLRLEGTGVRQDNILTREVDPATFDALLLNDLYD